MFTKFLECEISCYVLFILLKNSKTIKKKKNEISNSPVYPELSAEDGQNYRLQKISDIEKLLIKRETHERHYIKSINMG